MNTTVMAGADDDVRYIADQLLRKLQRLDAMDKPWPGLVRRQDRARLSDRSAPSTPLTSVKKPWGW